jgi:PBP1b-binding outer membrane lipoprotein LpoB
MKRAIILTSALSILALMLVSCSSGTTASTTRQTTTTTNAAENRMSQPTGYRDIARGSVDPTGGSGF